MTETINHLHHSFPLRISIYNSIWKILRILQKSIVKVLTLWPIGFCLFSYWVEVIYSICSKGLSCFLLLHHQSHRLTYFVYHLMNPTIGPRYEMTHRNSFTDKRDVVSSLCYDRSIITSIITTLHVYSITRISGLSHGSCIIYG